MKNNIKTIYIMLLAENGYDVPGMGNQSFPLPMISLIIRSNASKLLFDEDLEQPFNFTHTHAQIIGITKIKYPEFAKPANYTTHYSKIFNQFITSSVNTLYSYFKKDTSVFSFLTEITFDNFLSNRARYINSLLNYIKQAKNNVSPLLTINIL